MSLNSPSQITQPLSRSALSEGGVTALMTRAGNVTVTPVTLRSNPVSIPSRQAGQAQVSLSRHSSSPSLLDDDIGAGDYITLTSSNPALVFPQDREVPLDSITLDTDRGLVEESLNTANTRVILSSQAQPRLNTQNLVTGMVHSLWLT